MSRSKDICLNCEATLAAEDQFCAACGLNAHEKNLSIWYNVKVFFNTFLNFDRKLIHSFTDIWIPNKITKYYIAGKRSRHVHPFRFFFITLIAFFALVSIVIDDEVETSNEYDKGVIKLTELEIKNKLDSLSIKEPELFTADFIDSVQTRIFRGGLDDMNDTLTMNQTGLDYEKYGVLTKDYYELSADSLIKKYKIETTWEKIVHRQKKKIEENEKGALKYVIHNLLWGVILTTIIMASILFLLYVRHNSYFVEHVLHMINFHIMVLILNSVLLILHKFFGLSIAFTGFIWLFSFLFFLVALAKYYHQGFFKTLLKGIFFIIAYIFIFFLVLLFDLIISMAIF